MISLLIASGVGQYAAVMALFGSSLFALYAGVGSRVSGNSTTDRRMQHWLARILCFGALLAVIFAFGALLAVIFAFGALLAVASRMSGSTVGTLGRDTLLSVVFRTRFGKVWQAEVGLSLLLAAVLPLALASTRRRACYVGTLLASGALLVGLASVGHATMDSGVSGVLHLANHALHVMAAAAWLGGLLPLALALVLTATHRNRSDPWSSTARQCLANFSKMGVVAVAVLMLTGLGNAGFLIPDAGALLTTDYGRVLLIKVGLFTLMLAFAARNRFGLMPRLASPGAMAMSDADPTLSALRRSVLCEQVLGVLVLVAANILGTLPPPMGY
jgi:putative copper resistance protein D